MTLTSFVTKSVFRNKRRTFLTVVGIAFSFLLLSFMLTVWKSFYVDKGAPDSALRIMTRHRVSLANFLPAYYRQKIRTIPGVVHIVPMTWFGGKYKDDKPENYFAQFATDPAEYMEVAADKQMPADQIAAWQHDRAGAICDRELAARHGWKIGDRITLQGNIFPTNLDLTLRGIYTIDPPNSALYFDQEYLSQSVDWFKDTAGFYFTRVDSPESMSRVARAIDDEFHNTPTPTKSESEQAFKLDFIATLGFTRQRVLSLLLGESITISMLGGVVGLLLAFGLLHALVRPGIALPATLKLSLPTALVVMLVALLVGVVSGAFPSWRASHVKIVDGLRHIG
jgi:putative ABC transport system permease protein